MNSSKVWYVTGASQGLGLILVKKLLDEGYRVAATSRTADTLNRLVGLCDKTRFLALAVDLTNVDSIQQSVAQTIATFGQIDVVVNNAGYGMACTAEETSEQDIRNIFNINVLAAIDVTKSVLPVMRQQRSGYFINISSVAGFVGAPGWSIYSATKAAVTAFSEVLAADVKEFGIKVTIAEPSGFRTGFLTKDSLAFTESRIEGYEAVKSTQQRYLAMDGQQAGDPDKAAEIFIELAENVEPPLHLFMGADAYHRATEKLSFMLTEAEKWKATSFAADFGS
ncbi:SDR family NAD(P)-dependent oxidoreductase [Mucilaginibacter sp. SP1R1]|uniref:SDR family NAD(P)-dependent oxidoreductase n=1 Tax=Mucilaginibacter sp. SP1R1 TaxID=2723091 RepID=UPI0016220D03|nr:SDR family NAD(P)-dependent oxidoreductase [Mucilaginibacter sp. SP1R1]MBB6147693.1 NAD(P)-dependent dehydrogenase (short-subunit alcohol dehydrogenase family) [Mucilaginibacter sp. SP1R1]